MAAPSNRSLSLVMDELRKTDNPDSIRRLTQEGWALTALANTSAELLQVGTTALHGAMRLVVSAARGHPELTKVTINALIDVMQEDRRLPASFRSTVGPLLHGWSDNIQKWIASQEVDKLPDMVTEVYKVTLQGEDESVDDLPNLTDEQLNTLHLVDQVFDLGGIKDICHFVEGPALGKVSLTYVTVNRSGLMKYLKGTPTSDAEGVQDAIDRLNHHQRNVRKHQITAGVPYKQLTPYNAEDLKIVRKFYNRHRGFLGQARGYAWMELKKLQKFRAQVSDFFDDMLDDEERTGIHSTQRKLMEIAKEAPVKALAIYVLVWWVGCQFLGTSLALTGSILTSVMFGRDLIEPLWYGIVHIPIVVFLVIMTTSFFGSFKDGRPRPWGWWVSTQIGGWAFSTWVSVNSLFFAPLLWGGTGYMVLLIAEGFGAMTMALGWRMIVKGFDPLHGAIRSGLQGLNPASSGALGELTRNLLGLTDPGTRAETKGTLLVKISHGWGHYSGTVITLAISGLVLATWTFYIFLPAGLFRGFGLGGLTGAILFMAEFIHRNQGKWSEKQQEQQREIGLRLGWLFIVLTLMSIPAGLLTSATLFVYQFAHGRGWDVALTNPVVTYIDESLGAEPSAATPEMAASEIDVQLDAGEDPRCRARQEMVKRGKDHSGTNQAYLDANCQ